MVHGMIPADLEKDAEGMETMRTLGRNMAWLLKMKEATSATIEPPLPERKVVTNFIR